MADRSKIEWTDATWNPIRARLLNPPLEGGSKRDSASGRGPATGRLGWHCEHVSEGCRNCYAESINRRLGTGLDFKPGHRNDIEIFLDEKMLTHPLRWKRPRKIFVGSMTDLFADFVTDAMLDRIFAVMALCPQHTFQLLTKRPARMRAYVTGFWRYESIYSAMADVGAKALNDEHPFRKAFPDGMPWPLPNIWLGVSCEDQATADARIPDLLATPAAKRFLSCEPLLGPIDLRHIRAPLQGDDGIEWKFDSLWAGDIYEHMDALGHWCSGDGPPRDHAIDWVIAGGESGPNARPMHPDWARAARDACARYVPFFFKQWGEWTPWSQFADAADVDDDPEQTKFRTIEWEDGRWNDVGYPMWCDWVDGAVDENQCVGRVGKKAAGRLLDGRDHSEFPTAREALHFPYQFFVLSPEIAKLFNEPCAFGPPATARFSEATWEMQEAVKCLALDRPTASAFHSIRSLEVAIRAISRSLQIPDPTRASGRNWGAMLKSIKDEIDGRWPGSSTRLAGDGEFFDNAYAALAAMQNPWRNATMHLDQKYTESDAKHIFGVVTGFMSRVASRMDENGDPKA